MDGLRKETGVVEWRKVKILDKKREIWDFGKNKVSAIRTNNEVDERNLFMYVCIHFFFMVGLFS